jgi:hypothetical protein
MRSADDIKKSIKNLNIAANTERHKRVLGDLLKLMEKSKKEQPQAYQPTVWRIIMKSRMTKLAAAAVIIVAVLVGVIQWLPNSEYQSEGQPSVIIGEKVEIPVELAQMPIDELMEIHFGKAETSFDSKTVAAAVKAALDRLSGREVLALGGKYRGGGKHKKSAERMPYYPKPVSVVVEDADVIIRARVNRVELDVSDLKAAIVQRNLSWIKEEFVWRTKAEVEMEVSEGYPKLPGDDSGRLLLRPVFRTNQLNLLEQGKEYIIALHEHGQLIWMLSYGEGIYPVDPNSETVSGFRARPMPLDDAWHFICDSYDTVHEGNEPSQEALDYWTDRLQSDDLTDNWTAVEYFNTLAEPPVDAQMIAAAVQRQIKTRNEEYQRSTFVKEAVELLLRLADAQACEKILAICEENVDFSNDLQPLMLRAIISLSQDGETERLKRYLGRIDREQLYNILQSFIKNQGNDVEQILLYMLEDPTGYGIPNTDTLQLVWYGLAKRGNPHFRAYIEEFLADPENTDLGVEHYENNIDQTIGYAKKSLSVHWPCDSVVKNGTQLIRDTIERYRQGKASTSIWSVASDLKKYLQPKDREFIPFISEIVTENWQVPGIIATRIPDPCFVEPLREAIASKYGGDLVQALYRCGAEEEAIGLAYAHLTDYVNDPNRREVGPGSGYSSMWLTIRMLGMSGDESVYEVIEAATYSDVFRGRYVSGLQGAAIMAMARLGGESAIERLREIYASNDYYMRIAAAVSLYYLGDESGYDLLEHFINHTERSIQQIEMRWRVDMHGGKPFHESLLYLRSPDTDQLFLHRLRNGVGDQDARAFEIVKAYKAEALPILVENLSNRHRGTRNKAKEMLNKLTGKSFGFDPGMYAGQQQEAIEKWRSYIEGY